MKKQTLNRIKRFLLFPDRVLVEGAVLLIKIYQKTISPDHSAYGKMYENRGCKFYPSCSEYAISVFRKKGFVLGIWKVLWRVLRCHPFSKGGIDKP